MPKVDLSITISAIIAVVAVISPIFTALINNHHQLKLKSLEIRQEHFEKNVLHERDIFEKYIVLSSHYLRFYEPNDRAEYQEAYFLAYTYAPDHLRDKMQLLNDDLNFGRDVSARNTLDTLTRELSDYMKHRQE